MTPDYINDESRDVLDYKPLKKASAWWIDCSLAFTVSTAARMLTDAEIKIFLAFAMQLALSGIYEFYKFGPFQEVK